MHNSLVLPTERADVLLRQLTPEDAPAYFAAVDANRQHLNQFGDITAANYPDLQSVEDSIRNPKNPNKLRLGIWHEDTFAGSVNLTPGEDGAEIGYWLDSRYTGRGYATLAAKALAEYAKERYPKVHAVVTEGNEASTRVLERAGFMRVAKQAGRVIFEFENQPAPQVRAAKAEDATQLRLILEQSIRSSRTGLPMESEIESTLESIKASAEGLGKRRYAVAEDAHGEVVGVMGLAEPDSVMRSFAETDKPIEIVNAYVARNQRGNGVGRALVGHLEKLAASEGYTEVVVNSGPRYRESGWPFWEKMYGAPSVAEKYYDGQWDAMVWRKSLSTSA